MPSERARRGVAPFHVGYGDAASTFVAASLRQSAKIKLQGVGPESCGGSCAYSSLDLTPGPTIWKVGTFTPVNRAIPSNGRVLNSVDLNLTFQFDANVLGTNPTSITKAASFFIDHSETTNPNGDDVLFNLPGSETQFLYNGYTYGLLLYSMKQQQCTGPWWNQSCNDVATTGFDTAEGQSSTGDLYAKIRVVPGQPNIVTSEPSTYALMAAGLAALGAVSRRRRKAYRLEGCRRLRGGRRRTSSDVG